MARPTSIDFNSVGLNDYPFMISLVECNGNYNAVDDLSAETCVPSKTKDVNVKYNTYFMWFYMQIQKQKL